MTYVIPKTVASLDQEIKKATREAVIATGFVGVEMMYWPAPASTCLPPPQLLALQQMGKQEALYTNTLLLKHHIA